MQHMWYVLIRGKQTAVRRGRLVLSESVYLNSPPSLFVQPSITCLPRTQTYAYLGALRMMLKRRLCLCQFCMRCYLGFYGRWCFHCSSSWPWMCKLLCEVTECEGVLTEGLSSEMTYPTRHITLCSLPHTHCAERPGVSVYKWEPASTCKYGEPMDFQAQTVCMLSLHHPLRGKWQALLRGWPSLSVLFVCRVTSCPLTPDPSPLTSVCQPADTSTELTAPKAHWPRKHRVEAAEEEEEKKDGAIVWPSTSLGLKMMYAQREMSCLIVQRIPLKTTAENKFSFMKKAKQRGEKLLWD